MAPRPLISVADLRRLESVPTLLDVRYRLGGPPGFAEFQAGHIPGAWYVDLDTALAGPPGRGGRHPLPDPAVFEEEMRRAGVGDRTVVVYDDWAGQAAARCWWLLRHHGHPDVRVLDGGWPAWLDAGGAVATGDGVPGEGTFRAGPGRQAAVDAAEVPRIAADGVLVDARAPERFRGVSEPVDPVAGHIPGAVNVPTSESLADDGLLRQPDELRELYAAAGVRADAPVAAYCGSGVTAAHQVLALEVAGFSAALYPGSWSEWITDPDRPVATTGEA